MCECTFGYASVCVNAHVGSVIVCVYVHYVSVCVDVHVGNVDEGVSVRANVHWGMCACLIV